MSVDRTQKAPGNSGEAPTQSVLATLREAIEAGLFPPNEPLLVAVSGGGDSVALLHALGTLAEPMGLGELIAGHVDHGLREESGEDADAVEHLCAALKVRFRRARVVVDGEGGVQAAARRARYQALEVMRRDLGAALILTAHTADDQAETLLLRLARGTSPSGLAGIRRAAGFLARPLLSISREELAEYCATHRLPVRADPSNDDPRYLRVRTRKEILPLLESRLGPGVRGALCRLAEISAEEDAFLALQARKLESEARDEMGAALRAATLMEAPPALARRVLVEEWRRASGDHEGAGATPPPLESTHIERMWGLLRAQGSWQVDLPGGVKAVLSCGLLVMGRTPWPALAPQAIQGPGTYHLSPSNLTIEATPAVGEERALHPDRAFVAWPSSEPLLVRGWLPGDRLDEGPPVAELLLRARVPRPLRPTVPVVFQGGRLIWVPGIRSRSVPADGPALALVVFRGKVQPKWKVEPS